ncbi:MAG TPA: HEAT repeat domain-containing protein [Anaeromyxobacter sp.]|nr:HEAT repeat domain-containing protein [Anaeromyxobacter sp.]
MRQLVVAATALLWAAGCGNPSDAAGWARRAASRSRTQEKLEALEQVRRSPGDRRAAVPYLLEVLKQSPKVRAEAALVLGEIGDPAAIPGLVAAVDPGASDRDGFEANRKLSTALGSLRAREAVPVLLKLTSSPDGYTQVAAVDALGLIGDPAAVGRLVEVAGSPAVEPVTAQHALLALGRIGDPRAAPVVVRMLYEERSGVSFFPQAAFAAVEIGRPMAPPLLAVLEGRDPALQVWARERKVVPGALYAKAAQLLGDVGGPESVPALVAKLGYRDADPSLELLVRVFAAESLGRLRAKESVRPLSELLGREADPDARDRYCEALARIGDPSCLPALRAAAQRGDWDMKVGPLTALSRLGGAAEIPVVERAREAECRGKCPADRAAAFEGMKARLAAAAACRDVKCWAKKLDDPRPEVRDRAALEVGRAGSAADAAALSAAILRPVAGDADLAARYHAVLGLGWIAGRETLGSAAPEIASRIDGMIASERGRRLTEGVNEDALRLAVRLRRGR